MRTEIMKNMIKRTTALLLLVALLVTFLPFRADAAVSTDTALTKLTDSYNPGTGSFTLSAQSRIFVVSEAATGVPADWRQTAELISSEFNTQFSGKNLPLPLVYGSADRVRSGDIILKVDGTSKLAAEGYELKITTDNCTVTAKDVDGLLYGAFMLLRHFSVYGGTTIPACTVKDEPDTKERTLMLDCARKYWSVNWIENLIRQMAWMGYNTLELHMTEDQGIRMNIWKDKDGNTVPDCNGNDFSWLPGYKETRWASDANNGQISNASVQDPNANKQYTRDDLIEILSLAKKYHIEVIPGVDVPGHCDYFIYQWYNSGASTSFTFNYGGKEYTDRPNLIYIEDSLLYSKADYPNETHRCYGTLDITNDYTKYLSLALIDAYAEFFKTYGNSTKINIGCDEIRGSLDYSSFVSYVNEVCAAMREKKYTVRAFNDYLYRSSDKLDSSLEICYWTTTKYKDPNNSNNTITVPVSSYINDGRTVYNCATSYNYYVLRYNASHGDARSPDCLAWGFHHSTEERIYSGCGGNCKAKGVSWNPCYSTTGWNPSKLSCVSDSNEYYYDGTQLGGGYFLIWGDWGGWSTEAEVWSGIDSSGTYNLIDRMWSNSVKMWNWDVNSNLSYSEYDTLRDKYRLYPGFTGPSTAPSMERASEMNQAPDFPSLLAAINQTPAYPMSEYTVDSYQAWQAAKNRAQTVYDNHLSTAAEVASATEAVNTAYANLKTIVEHVSAIYLLTTVNDAVEQIEMIEIDEGAFVRVIPTPSGYRFSYVEGSVTARKLFSGANAIVLTGTVSASAPAKVYYQNTPDLSLLKRLLDSAKNAPEGSAYATAVAAAQKFYDDNFSDPAASVTQADVDEQVKALIAARTKASFATDDVTTSIINVRSTSNYVAKGKSAVLIVTTSADVTELKITDSQSNNVELAECVAQASTMANGDVVKVWYLRFPMDTIGPFSYTLTATGNNNTTVSAEVTLTCK